jgi:hypothetical protein
MVRSAAKNINQGNVNFAKTRRPIGSAYRQYAHEQSTAQRTKSHRITDLRATARSGNDSPKQPRARRSCDRDEVVNRLRGATKEADIEEIVSGPIIADALLDPIPAMRLPSEHLIESSIRFRQEILT